MTRADLLLDLGSGQSRGCALVEFAYARDARAAKARLHDVPLRGRPLLVREDRDDFAMGGAGYGARLFVGNLAYSVAWYDLKDHFAARGFAVRHAEVLQDNSSGLKRSKGCGVVTLLDASIAQEAIAAMHNSEIKVRFYFERCLLLSAEASVALCIFIV